MIFFRSTHLASTEALHMMLWSLFYLRVRFVSKNTFAKHSHFSISLLGLNIIGKHEYARTKQYKLLKDVTARTNKSIYPSIYILYSSKMRR